MSWATRHIEKLLAGETVTFRPKGNSMVPLIKSGEKCTVAPISRDLQIDDIVLCKVKGTQYLHKITALDENRVQISNNPARMARREIKDGNHNVVLFHYACRVWNASHHGSFHLWGHSHGGLSHQGRSLDVGVDSWDYRPVTILQVKDRLAELGSLDDYGIQKKR